MKFKTTLKKISNMIVEQIEYNNKCDMLLSQFSIKSDVIIHLDKLTFI